MKKLIYISLIFVISNAFAQPAATVLFAKQKVISLREGKEYSLSRGSQLEPGDTVVTGAGALINIKYKNGTLVNIGENSRYKILAFSPNPSDVQIKAELSQGKIKFKTTGKSNESLKTPVIAMAITGTSAEIFVKSDKQTYLNLLEGNINNYAPGSYIATPQGVVAGAFPAEGQVNTPAGTDGSISDAETTETISSESADATDTADSTDTADATDTADSAEEASDTIGFIESAQVVDQATTDSIEEEIASEIAEISLECISVI